MQSASSMWLMGAPCVSKRISVLRGSGVAHAVAGLPGCEAPQLPPELPPAQTVIRFTPPGIAAPLSVVFGQYPFAQSA